MRDLSKFRTFFLPVLVAVVAATVAAGCSSSSKSSAPPVTTTTTAPSAVCQSAHALRTSITALTDPTTYTSGKAGAQAALDNVKQNLQNVKTTLQSGDKPKVDQLQTALDELQTAINNMSGISSLGAVATAGKNVGTAAQGVLDAVKAGCPSA